MNLEKIINIISAKMVQTLSVFGGIVIGLLVTSYLSTGQMVSNWVFSILNSSLIFGVIFGYLLMSVLLELYDVKENIFDIFE